MAQMNVPAEPSYKTTSYAGLKGADFSNDPSLVARNHSPDLLNMISDNGGSPIKRKGWEVTGKTTNNEAVLKIWHFQMFDTVWHIMACQKSPSQINLYEFDDDGVFNVNNPVTLNCDHTPCGFFFNSADASKTGFYILHGSGIEFVRPLNDTASALTFSTVSPTVPVIRTLSNPDGSGGVSSGVNLLTRQMTVEFWDDRENLSNRTYQVFPNGSGLNIKTGGIINVKVLKADGTWEDKTSSATRTSGKVVTLAYNIPVKSNIENVVSITVEATANNANFPKIANCTCSTTYSQMAEGQVFVSGNPEYPQYVWYSETADPCYFPDINYLFVGGAGTKVTGMMPYGAQIAVFKEPSVTESTIFLLIYSQATDQIELADGTTYTSTRDVYQVKHGFAGVGSLSSDTTLSLSDEPLFLSQNGIMGLVSNAVNSSNSVKNRSGYLDPKLLEEDDLSNAIATVHKNYYILVLNGHAYVLDARQKTSDYKGNTSYMYESYYWDNIPATAIESDRDTLWFGTADGRLCRFKKTGRMTDYSDNTRYGDTLQRVYVQEGETPLSSTWLLNSNKEVIIPDNRLKYVIIGKVTTEGDVVPDYNDGTYKKYDVFTYSNGYVRTYTISPVHAVWSTPLDNDGATNYFKTLQKKGSGCTLYPYNRSSVDAYLQKDGNAELYVGSTTIDIDNWEDIDFSRFSFIASKAPRDMFFRKKMKKYKRLKIILRNEQLDEGFGVQEIFKTYLLTRYAK